MISFLIFYLLIVLVGLMIAKIINDNYKLNKVEQLYFVFACVFWPMTLYSTIVGMCLFKFKE